MKRPFWVVGTAGLISVILAMLTGVRNGILILAALVGAALFFCVRKRYDLCKRTAAVAVSAAVFLGLFAYNETCLVAPAMQLEGKEVSLTGQVLEMPVQKQRSIELKLGNCTLNGQKTRLRFTVYTDGLSVDEVGLYDTVEIPSVTPEAAADDGEFRYHTLSGRYWLRGYARQAKVTEKYRGKSLLYGIKRLRAGIKRELLNRLGEPYGSISAALLIGDRSNLDPGFVSALRVSGASHIFAVSGMHLSLWSGLLFLLLQKRSKVLILPNVLASLFVVAYAALTGFSPSVLRAGIMAVSVFIGRILRRRNDPLNALGLSATALLLTNVYLAGNVSFLLSYWATAAIVILVPSFTSTIRYKDNLLLKQVKKWKNAVFLSLAVLLFTVPFSGFFFGTVSLLSPVSALLCTLPVEINMVTSFLGVLLRSVPGVGRLVLLSAEGAAMLIEKIVLFLGRLDFAVFPLHLFWVLLWYAVTGAAVFLVYRWKKKPEAALCTLLAGVIVLLCVQLGIYAVRGKDVEIYVPAAGNSTCVCFSDVYGSNAVLIGTGRDYEALKQMRSYRNSRGISAFGTVVIPRLSDAENGNTGRLQIGSCKKIYSPANNPELAPGTYVEAENYRLELPFGFTYTNILSDGGAAGILENGKLKIVLLYYPGGEYEASGDILTTGDYLICRGTLPNAFPTDGFENVIVLSDKTAKELRLPDGVSTTAETGDLFIQTTKD